MQQSTTKNEQDDLKAHDYKRLLLEFADDIGHLDELSNYVDGLTESGEFSGVDFTDLQFDLNQ